MATGDETQGAAAVTGQETVGAADAERHSDLSAQAAEKFPRFVRIVRSSDYQTLYKKGHKVHSSNFVLFSRGNSLGYSRMGITASRKVGGAVVRNRVKRLFREIFRRSLNQIQCRLDIVVNAKSGCGGVRYEDLRTEFLTAVKKLANRYSE